MEKHITPLFVIGTAALIVAVLVAVQNPATFSDNLGGFAIGPGQAPEPYASPYDVYDDSLPQVLSVVDVVDNNDGSFSVTLTGQSAGGYVYNKGYYLSAGGWHEFTFPQATVAGSSWIAGQAQVTITDDYANQDVAPNSDDFVFVGYTCKQYDNVWRCGCRSQGVCSRWVIQSADLGGDVIPPSGGFSIGASNTPQNEQVVVDVFLDGYTSLYGYDFTLEYDETKLALVSYTSGSFMGVDKLCVSPVHDDVLGTVRVACTNTGTSLSTADGTSPLYQFVFQPLSVGSVDFSVTQNQLAIWPDVATPNTVPVIQEDLGAVKSITITPSTVTCGDGLCESGETASSCAVDCGDLFPEVSVTYAPASPTNQDTITFTATATDDVGISLLEVLLDGNLVSSCSSSPCTYTGGPFTTTHSYQARATDTVGQITLSTLDYFDVSPGGDSGGSVVLSPTDDTYIRQDVASNFGSDEVLLVDTSSVWYETFLKFVVPSAGVVQSAKLRLYNFNPSNNGGTVRLVENGWTEMSLTSANVPAVVQSPVVVQGAVDGASYVEWDVSSLVSAPGTYSFNIVPESSNGADYYSKEYGQYPPELVVVFGSSTGQFCGNGLVESGEQCDAGSVNGQVCTPAYGSTCSYCSAQCLSLDVIGPYCGDGICDAGETSCTADCGTSPVCGNGLVESGEQCDNGATNGNVCTPPTGSSCSYCDATCATVTVVDPTCSSCMTRAQVAAERSMCLYIYENDVYRKGSYPNQHHGNACGSDVTSDMKGSHISSPDTYLVPNFYKPLCDASCP